MQYPKHKYKKAANAKGYEVVVVLCDTDEKALGAQFHDSPADFGLETCPAKIDTPGDDEIPVFSANAEEKKTRTRRGA